MYAYKQRYIRTCCCCLKIHQSTRWTSPAEWMCLRWERSLSSCDRISAPSKWSAQYYDRPARRTSQAPPVTPHYNPVDGTAVRSVTRVFVGIPGRQMTWEPQARGNCWRTPPEIAIRMQATLLQMSYIHTVGTFTSTFYAWLNFNMKILS